VARAEQVHDTRAEAEGFVESGVHDRRVNYRFPFFGQLPANPLVSTSLPAGLCVRPPGGTLKNSRRYRGTGVLCTV
jgi:hypothetical protein